MTYRTLAALVAATMLALTTTPSAGNPLQPTGKDIGDGCRSVEFRAKNNGKTYQVVRLSCPPGKHSGAKKFATIEAYEKSNHQCRWGSDTPLSFSGKYTACQQSLVACGKGSIPSAGFVDQLPSDLAQTDVPTPICEIR